MNKKIERLIEKKVESLRNTQQYQEKNIRSRDIVERLYALERKVNRMDQALNDLIGNVIEYRTDLSRVREMLRHGR